MVTIREALEEDIERIEEYAKQYPETQVLVLHDIRHERDRADFYVAVDEELEGYMIVYRGFRDFYSTIIEAKAKEVFEKLLKMYIKVYGDTPSIIHVWEKYAGIALNILDPTSTYKYYIMSLTKNMCRKIYNPLEGKVIELKSIEGLEYSKEVEQRLRRLIEPHVIVVDNRVVAVGGYCATEPEAYMICGVYVEPDYRGGGFGKAISSILVEEAFKHTDIVTLWVGEDNYPAIHVYLEIGFKAVCKNMWINIGIDKRP